ncbi:hypothetical protein KCU83_g368, partial [Aureobasidium melanogenum]
MASLIRWSEVASLSISIVISTVSRFQVFLKAFLIGLAALPSGAIPRGSLIQFQIDDDSGREQSQMNSVRRRSRRKPRRSTGDVLDVYGHEIVQDLFVELKGRWLLCLIMWKIDVLAA